jgi:hypothetical protein
MQSLTDDVLTLLQILFLFYDRVTVASDRSFTSSFSFSVTGSTPAYRSTAVEAALRLPHRRPPLVCSPSDPLLWLRMAAPTPTPTDSLTIPNPVATVRDHHLATQRHDHHDHRLTTRRHACHRLRPSPSDAVAPPAPSSRYMPLAPPLPPHGWWAGPTIGQAGPLIHYFTKLARAS